MPPDSGAGVLNPDRRLKVAIWCPGIAGLGGGVKHGLLLSRPLVGLHDITVFHQKHETFDRGALTDTFGFDLGELDLKRWTIRRASGGSHEDSISS